MEHLMCITAVAILVQIWISTRNTILYIRNKEDWKLVFLRECPSCKSELLLIVSKSRPVGCCSECGLVYLCDGVDIRWKKHAKIPEQCRSQWRGLE